jgi:BirA family biotin operon repressor/biotin-[acetyl-CoA-carboxylase] ligase
VSALALLRALLDGAPVLPVAAAALPRLIAELEAEGWFVEASEDGTLGAYGEDVAFGPVALAWWSERCGLERPIAFVAETDSTNADLRALAEQGAPHGTALVAGVQRAGRGRLGRVWEQAPGDGVALSVVLRPQLPVARLPLLGLAAAVAVAETCGPEFRIKWPNDVLTPTGRKVAGLLAEADPAAGWVVLGVGVNANRTPADQPLAASLRDVDGDPRPRAELAARVVRGLLDQAARLAVEPEAVLDAWRARSATLGARVRVGDVEGVAVDIRTSGALVVRDSAGVEQLIYAGDVEMIGLA